MTHSQAVFFASWPEVEVLRRAVRAHGRAKVLRAVVIGAATFAILFRESFPGLFAPYVDTGLSAGSIRAAAIMASLIALAHEWSSRARRVEVEELCSRRLSRIGRTT